MSSPLTAAAIRRAVRHTLRFYSRLSVSPDDCVSVARAIRTGNGAQLKALLGQAAVPYSSLDCNPSGFVIGFPSSSPSFEICISTTVSAKRLNALHLRMATAAILPIHVTINRCPLYAWAVARAARAESGPRLRRLIAPKTPRLQAVCGDRSSIVFVLGLPNDVTIVHQIFVR